MSRYYSNGYDRRDDDESSFFPSRQGRSKKFASPLDEVLDQIRRKKKTLEQGGVAEDQIPEMEKPNAGFNGLELLGNLLSFNRPITNALSNIAPDARKPQASLYDHAFSKDGDLLDKFFAVQGKLPLSMFWMLDKIPRAAGDNTGVGEDMLAGFRSMLSADPTDRVGKVDTQELFDQWGWEKDNNGGFFDSWNNVAHGAAGFVGDVLLDPTTYFTLGGSALLKGGAKVAGKAALREGVELGAKELAGAMIKDAGEKLAKEAAERLSGAAAENLAKFGVRGAEDVVTDATREATKHAIFNAMKEKGAQLTEDQLEFVANELAHVGKSAHIENLTRLAGMTPEQLGKDLSSRTLRTMGRRAEMPRGMSFELPFTRFSKELVSPEKMAALGDKLRLSKLYNGTLGKAIDAVSGSQIAEALRNTFDRKANLKREMFADPEGAARMQQVFELDKQRKNAMRLAKNELLRNTDALMRGLTKDHEQDITFILESQDEIERELRNVERPYVDRSGYAESLRNAQKDLDLQRAILKWMDSNRGYFDTLSINEQRNYIAHMASDLERQKAGKAVIDDKPVVAAAEAAPAPVDPLAALRNDVPLGNGLVDSAIDDTAKFDDIITNGTLSQLDELHDHLAKRLNLVRSYRKDVSRDWMNDAVKLKELNERVVKRTYEMRQGLKSSAAESLKKVNFIKPGKKNGEFYIRNLKNGTFWGLDSDNEVVLEAGIKKADELIKVVREQRRAYDPKPTVIDEPPARTNADSYGMVMDDEGNFVAPWETDAAKWSEADKAAVEYQKRQVAEKRVNTPATQEQKKFDAMTQELLDIRRQLTERLNNIKYVSREDVGNILRKKPPRAIDAKKILAGDLNTLTGVRNVNLKKGDKFIKQAALDGQFAHLAEGYKLNVPIAYEGKEYKSIQAAVKAGMPLADAIDAVYNLQTIGGLHNIMNLLNTGEVLLGVRKMDGVELANDFGHALMKKRNELYGNEFVQRRIAAYLEDRHPGEVWFDNAAKEPLIKTPPIVQHLSEGKTVGEKVADIERGFAENGPRTPAKAPSSEGWTRVTQDAVDYVVQPRITVSNEEELRKAVKEILAGRTIAPNNNTKGLDALLNINIKPHEISADEASRVIQDINTLRDAVVANAKGLAGDSQSAVLKYLDDLYTAIRREHDLQIPDRRFISDAERKLNTEAGWVDQNDIRAQQNRAQRVDGASRSPIEEAEWYRQMFPDAEMQDLDADIARPDLVESLRTMADKDASYNGKVNDIIHNALTSSTNGRTFAQQLDDMDIKEATGEFRKEFDAAYDASHTKIELKEVEEEIGRTMNYDMDVSRWTDGKMPAKQQAKIRKLSKYLRGVFLQWGIDEQGAEQLGQLMGNYVYHTVSWEKKASRKILDNTTQEYVRAAESMLAENRAAYHRINRATIDQINNFTKGGAKEKLESLISRIVIERGLLHNKVMYTEQYANDVLSMFAYEVVVDEKGRWSRKGEPIPHTVRNPDGTLEMREANTYTGKEAFSETMYRRRPTKADHTRDRLTAVDEGDILVVPGGVNGMKNTNTAQIIDDAIAEATKIGLEGDAIQDFVNQALKDHAETGIARDFTSNMFRPWDAEKDMRYAGKVYAMPKVIYDHMIQAGKTQAEKDISAFMKLLDKATAIWKINATVLNPGFHIRNAVSNTFNNWLNLGAEALNPYTSGKAIEALRENVDPKKVVKLKDGSTLSLREIKKHAERLGVLEPKTLNDMLDADYDLSAMIRKAKSGKLAAVNPLDVENNALYELGRKASSFVESHARMSNFIGNLRMGKSFEEAAQLTDRYLFDYSDLSAFEKNFMKRIFPFYTWLRKNLGLQLSELLKDPRRYSKILKAYRNAGAAYDPETDDYRAPWLTNAIRLGTKDDKSTYLNAGFLPFMDLAKTPADLAGGLHPGLKLAIELGLNTDMFFGAPIESYRGETAALPQPMNMLYGLLDDNALRAMGMTRDADGQVRAPAKVRHAMKSIPNLENWNKTVRGLTEDTADDNNLTYDFGWLAGFKKSTVDDEQQRYWALKNYFSMLQDHERKLSEEGKFIREKDRPKIPDLGGILNTDYELGRYRPAQTAKPKKKRKKRNR